MSRRILFVVASLLSLPGVAQAVGPDVSVALIYDIRRWSRVGDITSYSIATTSCNMGDAALLWVANTSQHPVIAQNMYRLKSGRFEQIGMSWLKHGFASTNESACALCSNPSGGLSNHHASVRVVVGPVARGCVVGSHVLRLGEIQRARVQTRTKVGIMHLQPSLNFAAPGRGCKWIRKHARRGIDLRART